MQPETPAQAFKTFVWLAQRSHPLIINECWRTWPPEVVAALQRGGLIVDGPASETSTCRDCGKREPGNVSWPQPGWRDQRPLVDCSECGIEHIDMADLMQKRQIPDAWPGWFAARLGIASEPETLIPGDLWRLGRATIGDRVVVLFLARRLDDAPREPRLEQALAAPASFTLSIGPMADQWEHVAHSDVRSLVEWNGEDFICDRDALATLLPARTALESPPRARRVDPHERRIKRELSAHLKATVLHVRAQLDAGEEPTLLPELSQRRLAELCESSAATINRCLKESDELRTLADAANDLEKIVDLASSRRSRVARSK